MFSEQGPFVAQAGGHVGTCPRCGGTCLFAWDFQKLGKHKLRACVACRAVFVDGKQAEILQVNDALPPGGPPPAVVG